MSATGAIQAGSAFIRFFGEASELFQSFREVAKGVKDFATSASKDGAQLVAGGVAPATSAVEKFGTTSEQSCVAAKTGFQTVANSAMNASGAIQSANANAQALAAAGAATQAPAAGLQATAAAANSASTGLIKIPGILGMIGVGMKAANSIFRFTVGNLGNISRLLGLVSLGAYAVSQAMSLMGKDNAKVKEISAAFGRWGWYVWGVNLAIKTATGSLGLMRTAAMAPIRGVMAAWSGLTRVIAATPGLISRVSGALGRGFGRFGGLASVAAVTAEVEPSVAGGVEQEQQKSGGFMKSLMPILTGLAIAGPIGAAAVYLGSKIFSVLNGSTKEGALAGNKHIKEFADRVKAWGAWFTGQWTRITDKVKSVFGGGDAAKGESFLKRIEKAILPIAYNFEKTWVPAILRGIEAVGAFWKANQPLIAQLASFIPYIVAGAAAVAGLSLALSAVAPIAAAVATGVTAITFAVTTLASVAAAIGSFLISPLGLTVVAVGALVAAFFTLTKEGQTVLSGLGTMFVTLQKTATTTWDGIVDAVMGGDLRLAGKIAMQGLELAWLQTKDRMLITWNDFTIHFQNRWDDATTTVSEYMLTAFGGQLPGVIDKAEAAFQGVLDVIGAIADRIESVITSVTKLLPSLDSLTKSPLVQKFTGMTGTGLSTAASIASGNPVAMASAVIGLGSATADTTSPEARSKIEANREASEKRKADRTARLGEGSTALAASIKAAEESLAQLREDAAKKRASVASGMGDFKIPDAPTKPGDEDKKGKDKRDRESVFAGVSSQTQEAFAALARLQNSNASQKPEITLMKQQLDEAKKTTKAVEKIADNPLPKFEMVMIP